ncbi:MAG: B12-binding domain-containing radical SAM protein [Bacteroidetes bacterium]|nr:B12-binding domain-containing radical SAM protein [Bacteroidota bacterium]
MKALFTHSYFYKRDPKQWRFKQPYPPLGTLQAAAVVRESGFGVSFVDVALRDNPNEIEVEIKTHRPDFFIIYDDGFNYLTKMCLTAMRDAAFAMAKIAKQYNAVVIVCSSDATDHYEKYFQQGVDYVVRGEGEETLTELLRTLKSKQPTENILGIAFCKEGKNIVNPLRPVLRNLDGLPMPAWDLIDIEPYRAIWKKKHGYFSLNMATTRGCPYKCNWCAKPIYGNRYNSRSPEYVIKEVEYLLKKFQPDHFWMCDDIFGLKPGWIKRFHEIVDERKLKFNYKIQSRVDLLLEENTIEHLARSGAETIWVGAESGSQKILDAMDKGTTIQEIEKATRLMKEKKIRVGYFLQFGYTGEKKEDIEATIKMTLAAMPDEIGISVSYPLPGTKFYENVKSNLKEKQNWVDSDDLALLYRSTFSPVFYKLLHRYVHSRYRIKRGWEFIKQRNFKVRAIASMIYHAPVSVVQGWRLKQLQHAR